VRDALVRCAVGPRAVPDWFTRAILDGGGEIVDPADAEALLWYLGDPDGLAGVLRQGQQLRWVQLSSAGIEAYRDYLDDRVVWTCTKHVSGEPVAEHALALGLAGLRGVTMYGRRRAWSHTSGRTLYDGNVVILGGGGIAEALVRLLEPFRADVTVIRRRPEPMTGVARVLPLEQLHHALPAADLVVIALALTDQTKGVIGDSELRLMAPHAWLVNVGRGPHVVTADLIRALREGWIGGAALDVTDPEPLPRDHPLWSFDRCVITPHTANTLEMHGPQLAGLITENVRRFATGAPLLSQIDIALGY
jgi:D-3-phosphoglycerate dehydrogenase